ncbi:MAG: HAMP domain-containing sensor histidine kinase, partial [Methanomassiliicoccales archaeon]|nr:HAMP domain-containing sensor histidine kinase [Methanomassiliicoccales archaeon]
VLADLALGSVIDNLIRNARVHGKATRVNFVIETTGPYTELRVEDDGKGVPEEIRGKIFHEGYSFGETKGTGLGLYLAQKTMERHGGKIRAENTVPRGATFVLSFPRMESFPG